MAMARGSAPAGRSRGRPPGRWSAGAARPHAAGPPASPRRTHCPPRLRHPACARHRRWQHLPRRRRRPRPRGWPAAGAAWAVRRSTAVRVRGPRAATARPRRAPPSRAPRPASGLGAVATRSDELARPAERRVHRVHHGLGEHGDHLPGRAAPTLGGWPASGRPRSPGQQVHLCPVAVDHEQFVPPASAPRLAAATRRFSRWSASSGGWPASAARCPRYPR
jgi:hypothetical protein